MASAAITNRAPVVRLAISDPPLITTFSRGLPTVAQRVALLNTLSAHAALLMPGLRAGERSGDMSKTGRRAPPVSRLQDAACQPGRTRRVARNGFVIDLTRCRWSLRGRVPVFLDHPVVHADHVKPVGRVSLARIVGVLRRLLDEDEDVRAACEHQ